MYMYTLNSLIHIYIYIYLLVKLKLVTCNMYNVTVVTCTVHVTTAHPIAAHASNARYLMVSMEIRATSLNESPLTPRS